MAIAAKRGDMKRSILLRGRVFKMPISRTPCIQDGRKLAATTVALALLISSPWLGRSVAQSPPAIQGKEHYAMRDGLRIYLGEKYKEGSEQSFSHTAKVARLVHGGTRAGRSLY